MDLKKEKSLMVTVSNQSQNSESPNLTLQKQACLKVRMLNKKKNTFKI